MIIDGHAHACGVYSDADSIQKYMESKGIDMVVLSAGEPDSVKNYYYPMMSKLFRGQNLAYVFNKIIRTVVRVKHTSEHLDAQNIKVSELQKQMPDKVINTYWVNPLDEDCIEKMERFYFDNGFKMLKLHQCWTPFDINSPKITSLFKWAADKKLPVFIHLFSHEQVKGFVEVANKFHETTFIVGHMIGCTYLLEKLTDTNVYFDLSAPQLYSFDILEKVYGKIGFERLILGSDSPYGIDNIGKIIDRLKKLSLNDDQVNSICGENLIKILNLSQNSSILPE